VLTEPEEENLTDKQGVSAFVEQLKPIPQLLRDVIPDQLNELTSDNWKCSL